MAKNKLRRRVLAKGPAKAKRYRVRPLLDQSYYAAIGRAIVTWACLEIRLDDQLIQMLRHPNSKALRKAMAIERISHVPKALDKRLDLLAQLAQIHYSGSVLSTIEGIILRCRRLKSDRSRLAHGEWVLQFSRHYRKGALLSYFTRYGVRIKGKRLRVADIRRTIHEVGDAVADLERFMRDHHPDGPISKRVRALFEALERSRAISAPSATPDTGP